RHLSREETFLMTASFIEYLATVLFALAIIHTFSVPVFARLANKGGPHAGLWHLLSEVEAVFGVWAAVLVACIFLLSGPGSAVSYVESSNFTEPAFVFAIMVVAASRPIIAVVGLMVNALARLLPMRRELSMYFVILAFVPLAGSFITEPAAMTLAALLLRDAYFRRHGQEGFKYMTIGVLFVNVSIGGVLTAYAAPPVLMVAATFGWASGYMATHFGWRAAVAVIFSAAAATFICRRYLLDGTIGTASTEGSRAPVPALFLAIRIAFLGAIVLSAHHLPIFTGLLLLFIGFAHAYSRHHNPLLIREGLMVGFFLAGLVVLGGLQKWWLQDLLGGLSPTVLYWG